MRALARFISFSVGMMFLITSANSFAQNPPPKLNLSAIKPGYVKMPKININSVQPASSTIRLVLPKGVTSTRGVFVNDANSSGGGPHNNAAHKSASGDNSGPNLRGLDTVPTFTGAFNSTAPSIDFFQSSDGFTTTAPFIMIGNNPLLGDTTELPTNLGAISLQLLNPNGSVFANVPFAPFEDRIEDSPNFRNADYSVGHTQFADAVQRAEFFNMMEEDWHTLLDPKIVNRATIQVPATVQVQFFDGTVITVPGYIAQTASDGSTVVFMLDLLFNFLDFNQAVNDINSGAFSTKALNFHVYPNTFLFSVIDEQGDLACCVLGFHEFIFDPTTNPEQRWIYGFASWISPGTFGGGVQDVTAFSHETSEMLNDPFGNNIVPTWQFPGIFGACQANLETGDPVEVLATSTVPIVTREHHEVFTYHPQTEALLQWFEIGNPSNAIGGAFSYPDTTALPAAATPCPF
ncbi:MAG TPA: hypothetical protein VI685_23495 [Candidatus Angelobacter sp.]